MDHIYFHVFQPDDAIAEPEGSSGGRPVVTDGNNNKKDKKNLNFPWEKNVRLPSGVYPEHYDLYLYPDLDTGAFMGNLNASLQC